MSFNPTNPGNFNAPASAPADPGVFPPAAGGVSYRSILAPPGTNNDILLTSFMALAALIAINSTDARFATTAALVGEQLVITSGDKAQMEIGGSLGYDDGEGNSGTITFPRLRYAGLVEGLPSYESVEQYEGAARYYIRRLLGSWRMVDRALPGTWVSSENVASPDLVTSWTPNGPATGTPTVAARAASAAVCILAVTNASLGIVATNDEGSDGSGTVSATGPVPFVATAPANPGAFSGTSPAPTDPGTFSPA